MQTVSGAPETNMLEIDKILKKCGDAGWLQFRIMVLFCLINLLSSLHYYSQTIISFVPKHRCIDGPPQQELRQLSESSCAPSAGNSSRDTCEKYEYNYDEFMGYKSIASDLDWICDDAWQLTLGQSMFFVGSVIGTLVFGYLADVIGRLPTLIAANMVAMLGNVLTIFGTTLTSFCIFRLISGLATDSNFVMMYILVMEYLRPSMRTFGLNLCIGFFYCLGSMAAPWIGVLAGTWRGFLIVTSIPFAIIPFYYFMVPESAQWLVSVQKYDRAVKCLKRVAKANNKQVEESVYTEFVENCKRSYQHTKTDKNLFDLFKTPRLRRNTLILFFKSMVITLCYDAVSRNVQGLGISPFLMFTLSATTILPACVLLITMQDRIGRKAMASISLFLSGIFISVTGGLIFHAQQSTNPKVTMVVALSIIGRFGVTVAYNSSAQYATELIPTCVRGQGVATVHVVGYAFTFFSSYILYTREIFSPLPEIILGSLSMLGAALCLLLPETLNRTLPTTIQDGENFGKNERWFHFSFMDKRSQSVDTLATNISNQNPQDS